MKHAADVFGEVIAAGLFAGGTIRRADSVADVDALSQIDRIRHRVIAPSYPGTEAGFLSGQISSFGSKKRSVFFVMLDGEIACFFATSNKGHDGVKLNSIWIAPSLRGKKGLSWIVDFVASRHPYQDVFLTCPANNFAMNCAAKRAGLLLMGSVDGLYRQESDEVFYFKPASKVIHLQRSSKTTLSQIPQTILRNGVSASTHSITELSRLFPNLSVKRGGAVCIASGSRIALTKLDSSARTADAFIYGVVPTCSVSAEFRNCSGWQVMHLGSGKSFVFNR